jgi:DNA-binding transcriptional ArsR family regulator
MSTKKKHRLWKGHLEIFSLLLKEPLTYSELKERTGFSDNTLSGFLDDLEDQGKIFKKPAKRRRDEKYTTFEINSEDVNSHLDRYSELTQSIKCIPHSVKDLYAIIRLMKDSKGIEENVLRANILLLAAWMPDLLYNVLSDEPEDVHRRIDELIDGVVKPWAHSLFELGFVYPDMSKRACTEVRNSLYLLALSECERYAEIMKLLP